MLEKANINVVAVSYDPVEAQASFAEKAKITFPLLADVDSKVIKQFGIYNDSAKGVYKGISISGVPHPGTFLVDEKGIVRGKIFLEGYRDRHTPNALIAEAKKILAEQK